MGIVSGAVVGLGLGLMVSAIFGPEYIVYAVVAGVALGVVFGGLIEHRRSERRGGS